MPAEALWQPILREPDSVERARHIVRCIEEVFVNALGSHSEICSPRLRSFVDRAQGIEGSPAVLLVYTYLYLEGRDSASFETTLAWVEQALRVTETDGSVTPWLFDGVAGTGWVVHHALTQLGLYEDLAEDPNEDLDHTLTSFLDDGHDTDAELVMGLAGLGTYFLDRLPREHANDGLNKVIARLESLAEERSGGIAWRKRLSTLSPSERVTYPESLFNLGYPHGVSGIIGFLARVCMLSNPPPGATRLLTGAVRWLLAQRAPAGASVFPCFSDPVEGPLSEESRLAWCYGDLGISVAVLMAARALRRDDWGSAAVELAVTAARRTNESSGVVDDMFCHGAAGNAHLFNRLYQSTRHPELAEAALTWYRRVLDDFDPSLGQSGYRCWIRDQPDHDDTGYVYTETYGLTVGVTGIALVLLAGIGSVEPCWDRALAVSVPPSAVSQDDISCIE